MKKICLFTLFILLFCQPSMAFDVSDMAKSRKYNKKWVGMLSRGITNTSSFYFDFLFHLVQETSAGPPIVGTLRGLGSGTACSTLRAVSGLMDLGTFWIPKFNGISVAKNYTNCLLDERVYIYGFDPAEVDSIESPSPKDQK